MEWVNPSTRWKELMLHPFEELEARMASAFLKLCVDCKSNVVTKIRIVRDDLVVRLTEFFKLESKVVVAGGAFSFD